MFFLLYRVTSRYIPGMFLREFRFWTKKKEAKKLGSWAQKKHMGFDYWQLWLEVNTPCPQIWVLYLFIIIPLIILTVCLDWVMICLTLCCFKFVLLPHCFDENLLLISCVSVSVFHFICLYQTWEFIDK